MLVLNKKNILIPFLLVLLVTAGCSTPPKPHTWLIHKPVFAYPLEAQRQGLEGKVLLLLYVKPNGRVDTVIVRKSSGYKILDDAAVSFASKFFYRPFKSEDGIWLNVPIVFKQRVAGEKSFVGKVWKSEKSVFRNKISSQKITRWTDAKSNNFIPESPVSPFVNENQVIFLSDRGKADNLFLLNLIDGTFVQMTNEKEDVTNVVHLPEFGMLWYKAGEKIHYLNTQTLQNDVILNEDSVRISKFTVTADGKFLLFSSNGGNTVGPGNKNSYSRIFLVDLQTKQMKNIKKFNNAVITALVANPGNEKLILIQIEQNESGERKYEVFNLLKNTETLVVPMNKGFRVAKMEWANNGRCLAFSGVSNSGKKLFGLYNYETGQSRTFTSPLSISDFQVFKDNSLWLVTDGKVLILLKTGKNKVLYKKALFSVKGNFNDGSDISGLHFNPNGKEVFFDLRRNGKFNVYSLKVNLL